LGKARGVCHYFLHNFSAVNRFDRQANRLFSFAMPPKQTHRFFLLPLGLGAGQTRYLPSAANKPAVKSIVLQAKGRIGFVKSN
jgi:hypothetical protein